MINFLQTLTFSEDEIKSIEKLFFKNDVTFNLEQRNVISCFSKENIQACPGSGKTTTLAAKLLLLRQKLPHNTRGGICILTHTNVAVDIIKKRLGHESAVFYSNYPNYLGTIQSFVNKFLAAPAYQYKNKKTLQAVDDDLYQSIIEKRKQQALITLKYLSRNKGIDDLGKLSFNIHNFDISIGYNNIESFVGKDTPSYKQLLELKNKIFEEGFLKYDEAYSLAYWYLRKFPILKSLVSKRFPLVFLDEMQDTDAAQFNLLNDLFGNNSIFQTIGDVNQDIYGNYKHIVQHFPASTRFSITTCSRFPHHIAEFIKKVSVEPHDIKGEISNNPIKPHIIVYDDNTIDKVKEMYGRIIISKELHKINKSIFKAVGNRKDEGKINIVSYLPEFNKRDQKVKAHYPTLADYIKVLTSIRETVNNVKPIEGLITSIFVEALRLNSIKNKHNDRLFTAKTLETYLKHNNPDLYYSYKLTISKLVSEILKGSDISQLIKNFLLEVLLKYFKVSQTPALTFFLNSSSSMQQLVQSTKQNCYTFSSGSENVEILFDTVHGVKGETHTGTLFMETYNRCYDLQKILPLISGTQNRTPSFIKNNQERMKTAYVAMSRPTHLLCLAIHKDRINLSLNWEEHGVTIVHS
jgi:DNA helicase-2/ATP-dependent DNA helicase PcrA